MSRSQKLNQFRWFLSGFLMSFFMSQVVAGGTVLVKCRSVREFWTAYCHSGLLGWGIAFPAALIFAPVTKVIVDRVMGSILKRTGGAV